jgi:hypothetical protein
MVAPFSGLFNVSSNISQEIFTKGLVIEQKGVMCREWCRSATGTVEILTGKLIKARFLHMFVYRHCL